MRITSAFQAGHLIAEMTNDIWQKKHKLLSNERPFIYLPYRLSVSDRKNDVDCNFYIHFVVSKNRWWVSINDKPSFQMEHPDELIAFDDVTENWDTQITSWRHYAFSDLLPRAVQKKIETITANMSEPGEPYLWDTFPLEETPRFSEEAKNGTKTIFEVIAEIEAARAAG